MTNGEKYKTAQERADAFQEFLDYMCNKQRCSGCKLRPCGLPYERAFAWLDLEAEEEKPLPCPFCGGEVQVVEDECEKVPEYNREEYHCFCYECDYLTKEYDTRAEAIAAHNRVAKKCREVK